MRVILNVKWSITIQVSRNWGLIKDLSVIFNSERLSQSKVETAAQELQELGIDDSNDQPGETRKEERVLVIYIRVKLD